MSAADNTLNRAVIAAIERREACYVCGEMFDDERSEPYPGREGLLCFDCWANEYRETWR